jgi:hypothetical protein
MEEGRAPFNPVLGHLVSVESDLLDQVADSIRKGARFRRASAGKLGRARLDLLAQINRRFAGRAKDSSAQALKIVAIPSLFH